MGVYKLSGAGGLLTPRVNYTSMLAGNEAFVESGDYELISTSILASAAPSVTFDVSSFASTYKHLQIRMVTLGTTSVANQIIRFNEDSGNNYRAHFLFGDGSSVGSSVYSAAAFSQIYIGNSSVTANQFTATVVDILDAFSSTKNTTLRAFYGNQGSPNVVQLLSGVYLNTGPLESVFVGRLSNNFTAGSRFSIYGIRG